MRTSADLPFSSSSVPVPWPGSPHGLSIAAVARIQDSSRMAFAGVLLADRKKAYRLTLIGGLACLALFPLLRVLGGFGNLRLPAGQSLGFDLVMLSLFSRAAHWLSTVARPLVTLGQAALYFFLVHWFVYAVLGGAFFPTPGGLPATYLIWILGLVASLPICKNYESFKHRMPAASVWRMI